MSALTRLSDAQRSRFTAPNEAPSAEGSASVNNALLGAMGAHFFADDLTD
jgi:hypothetical protein